MQKFEVFHHLHIHTTAEVASVLHHVQNHKRSPTYNEAHQNERQFHRTLYFINLVSLNNCPSSILSTQLAINVSVLCSCHAEDAASAWTTYKYNNDMKEQRSLPCERLCSRWIKSFISSRLATAAFYLFDPDFPASLFSQCLFGDPPQK